MRHLLAVAGMAVVKWPPDAFLNMQGMKNSYGCFDLTSGRDSHPCLRRGGAHLDHISPGYWYEPLGQQERKEPPPAGGGNHVRRAENDHVATSRPEHIDQFSAVKCGLIMVTSCGRSHPDDRSLLMTCFRLAPSFLPGHT